MTKYMLYINRGPKIGWARTWPDRSAALAEARRVEDRYLIIDGGRLPLSRGCEECHAQTGEPHATGCAFSDGTEEWQNEHP